MKKLLIFTFISAYTFTMQKPELPDTPYKPTDPRWQAYRLQIAQAQKAREDRLRNHIQALETTGLVPPEILGTLLEELYIDTFRNQEDL